jgi:hypothetical protein
MEQELLASRKFLLLSYSIYKVKYIEKPNRVENPRAFLEEIYNEYTKLVENSNLIKNAKLKDALAPIPDSFKSALVPTPTSTKQPTNFGVELHQLADMPIV